MKFFNYNTATALERPSVQGWLLVFVCGFLTICIIDAVLCAALWLFAAAMKSLHQAPLPAWDIPLLSAASVILQTAVAFGVLLATVMVLEAARRQRREARFPGHHPVIGDYEHSPFYKTWHALPLLPTGKMVRLSAYGSRPSDTQAALWQQFIARYEELIGAATLSLLKPPHPLQGCAEVSLTPSGITLSRDGRLHLGFEFATEPKNDWESESEAPYPTASFSPALELKSTEWLKPYG